MTAPRQLSLFDARAKPAAATIPNGAPTLDAVRDHAEALMRHHGLAGWTFAFDRAKRRLGICCTDEKRITVSRHFVELNPWTEIHDTILHEIAHALTPDDRGHGKAWKAKAAEIGARPERCAPVDVRLPDEGRPLRRYRPVLYIGKCRSCGHEFSKRSTRHPGRRSCNGCYDTFDERALIEWRPVRVTVRKIAHRRSEA